jgi:Porphyromonas-type peptidyl-arginine deiminase
MNIYQTQGRSLLVIFMLCSFLQPKVCFADIQEEHPEWFGMTSPPAGSVNGASGLESGLALIAPQVGQGWLDVISFLAPRYALTILYSDDNGARAELESWLSQVVFAKGITWMEAGSLDTLQAGEWGPLAIYLQDQTLAFVDPRYYPNKLDDDSIGSRLALAMGTPAFRPPVFLTQGLFQTDGAGRCLISDKLVSVNVGINKEELDFLLYSFLGCEQVARITSFPSDETGNLDHLVRIVSPALVLLSAATGSDAAAVTAARTAIEALNWEDGFKIVEVPMAGRDKSYLTFLLADDAVLFPNYQDQDFTLEAEGIFQSLWPEKEIITVQADILAEFSLWPSRMVSQYPASPWNTDAQPPWLCETAKADECGFCLQECAPTWVDCDPLSELNMRECVIGEDTCRDFIPKACNEGDHCQAGECVPMPSPCDDIPAEGKCDGDLLIVCAEQTVITVNCQEKGEFCGTKPEGGLGCVAPCQDICEEVGASWCDEDQAGIQITCALTMGGCLGHDMIDCLGGCKDGACLENPGEIVTMPDAMTEIATLDVGGDTTEEVDSGEVPIYGKADSGCASAGVTQASGWCATLLAMLFLVFLAVRLPKFDQ